MSQSEFYVNVGPLNNLNSLYYHIGSQLPDLRNKVAKGEAISVVFDLQNIAHEKVNILTLVSFLSLSRKIAETLGKPINLLVKWEPNMLGFLSDIGFFLISKRLQIFTWDERMVGGYVSGKTNPNTKILYFADVQRSDWQDASQLFERKNELKQKIAPNFILRCGSVLREFNTKLVNTIANTTLELIVNSLIHGCDVAFVGLQRSSKRISISVADSGIGFRNSLLKYNPTMLNRDIDHYSALVFGSLIQKRQHGLKLAISELLNSYDGLHHLDNNNWILLSTYDTEIKWQRQTWESANDHFDEMELNNENLRSLCVSLEQEYNKEFVRKYSNYLVGSRITFEIPLM